jgi:hypothetical protein
MAVGHPAVSASDPIVYIDRSEIREGSLEELRAGIQRLVGFIEAREPRLIASGGSGTRVECQVLIEKSCASKAPGARVAEADGNRTRQGAVAPSNGFEDRGAHQEPRRLRDRG